MWGAHGYDRRRHRGYYYPSDRSRLLVTLLPLLQSAQEHLTTARTPVTIALLALQLALHYRAALLPGLPALAELLPDLGSLHDACILPARWWQMRRLALAPLLHVDDAHLYYNMVSLISKGASLEPALGSARFGKLVAGLALSAGVVHIALAFALRALSAADFGDAVRGAAAARLRRGCAPVWALSTG